MNELIRISNQFTMPITILGYDLVTKQFVCSNRAPIPEKVTLIYLTPEELNIESQLDSFYSLHEEIIGHPNLQFFNNNQYVDIHDSVTITLDKDFPINGKYTKVIKVNSNLNQTLHKTAPKIFQMDYKYWHWVNTKVNLNLKAIYFKDEGVVVTLPFSEREIFIDIDIALKHMPY